MSTSNTPLLTDLQVAFSMGNGQRKFAASADGDLVRVTIQDGESRHEWYYLDEQEGRKLHELLSAWLGSVHEPSGDGEKV